MNVHEQLRRPAVRTAISVALVGGIVTSVVAAYQGYQALESSLKRGEGLSGPAVAETLPGALAPGVVPAVANGSRADTSAASARGATPPGVRPAILVQSDRSGPAAGTFAPAAGWPGAPAPGWGLMPVSQPSAPAASAAWPVAPMSSPARAAGGWLPGAANAPPRAPMSLPGRASSPPFGPGRTGGKACGMGFG